MSVAKGMQHLINNMSFNIHRSCLAYADEMSWATNTNVL